MTNRFTAALVGLAASIGALVLTAGTAAGSSPSAAAHSTGTQRTPAPGHPRTWHVLVGGQAKDQAIQAEGYYPHVITIDVGDTVTWTLNTKKILGVVFAGTCEHASCFPKSCLTIVVDFSPCGPPRYNGVTALDSSGRMVPAAYNWDTSVPKGGTTFSLTFTRPGVNVYFDLSVPGMRGVVIVHPAGTRYPFTQAQYSQQAREQLRADLAAGARARSQVEPVTASANPDGTRTFHVALGASPPERARVVLRPAAGSDARGSALLRGSGIGTSTHPTIAVTIRLSGLAPGSVHAAQIRLGTCRAPDPQTTGIVFKQIFVPPAFELNKLTAGPGGTASSTTIIATPPKISGAAQLRIPGSGWFITVAKGPTPAKGAASVACGNVVFHNTAVMRYLPRNIHINVGDTVVWTDHTSNEQHGVTFLAGQPLPVLPEWYHSTPTPNNGSYDGSSFFNSGLLTAGQAGRPCCLTLTFTRAGTFPYVDVGDFVLEMQGNVIVAPPDSQPGTGRPHRE